MFVMVYVDDLLFLGQQQEVDKTFKEVQKHVLLRPTGTLGIGQTIQFLGRDIHNNGDYFEVSLKPEYIATLLKETKMEASNPASAPGTATLKRSTNDDAPLDAQERADYRRTVGKLQWLTYTRPDISFATKELARDLQQPTQHGLRKMKHLLRYLRGTQQYKMILRTMRTPQTKEPIDLNIYVDADWAGCPMMGSVVQFGSRTQAVVALSSAESELYAIGTEAQEGLHIANFIKEATTTKVNIRIHTDSTSGKSIATRIGSSKKAKHIDLKDLFIQQLVQSGILSIQAHWQSMSRQRCLTNTSTWRAFNAHNTTTEQRPYRTVSQPWQHLCVCNTTQYTHGGIKPWHTILATMRILCHRQYILQDFSLTMGPTFLSVLSENNTMNNCV